ncbi:hypothetical protein FNAPI_5410 [Fusarium napiforme]|uniref:Uncharacterized protein n=1 Tax=Fusarium napiforme TaxID=42672 RepID=A0A8H5NA78_9HYPO|nr:hypothetical protein FNAPI_5410 [Fusarium napiforme]
MDDEGSAVPQIEECIGAREDHIKPSFPSDGLVRLVDDIMSGLGHVPPLRMTQSAVRTLCQPPFSTDYPLAWTRSSKRAELTEDDTETFKHIVRRLQDYTLLKSKRASDNRNKGCPSAPSRLCRDSTPDRHVFSEPRTLKKERREPKLLRRAGFPCTLPCVGKRKAQEQLSDTMSAKKARKYRAKLSEEKATRKRNVDAYRKAISRQQRNFGKLQATEAYQNAHPSEKDKMLNDHRRHIDKIDQKYHDEGDTQTNRAMEDSGLEADDEWQDIRPKYEKMEDHFAYAQAATSFQHHVPPKDEEVGEILVRSQSLSPEGSKLFTVQEMATWFICDSSVHNVQNASRGVLGTNKEMNYNSPKDLKIRGLEILYQKSTSPVQPPNGRQWVRVPALVEATAHIVEWQAVETHEGLLWVSLAGWEAFHQMPPTTARPIPVEQDHGVGVVIDVLSGEDEAQGDIDRMLLSERDQNPHRLADLLIFTTQPWANEALPDTNPPFFTARGTRGGQAMQISWGGFNRFKHNFPAFFSATGHRRRRLLSNPRAGKEHSHLVYNLQRRPDCLSLESIPSSGSGEISFPDSMTKHIIRLRGPDGRYRETIEAGPSPGREYSLSDMMYEERWSMEAPPCSPQSSSPEQDDSIFSSTQYTLNTAKLPTTAKPRAVPMDRASQRHLS